MAKDQLIMEEFSKLVGASNRLKRTSKCSSGKSSAPKSALAMKTRTRTATKTGKRMAEDDDDDDDDDDEEDACPPGYDQTLDKVLELREKRLDQEEILNEFQKAMSMKRTGDRPKTDGCRSTRI